MTEITILYDRSETDEQGIRYTADQLGIELGYLPFHKVAAGVKNGEFIYKSKGKDLHPSLQDTQVVLNRTQAKHRRILAADILEAYGVHVMNPLGIELNCQSKVRTLLKFWSHGVRIPDTLYMPCNVHEHRPGGGDQNNTATIMQLVTEELGENVVIKADQGTHGNGIYLAHDEKSLTEALEKTRPGVINPAGVIAQEHVNKWFYDLRIVVEKRGGGKAFCHPTAMARGGFKDFRTNTYLGNMVFRVNLPAPVMDMAARCGEALGEHEEAYVMALDAMPRFSEPVDEVQRQLEPSYEELDRYFGEVRKAKSMKTGSFSEYTRRVEEAYGAYMASEPYAVIQSVIADSLDDARDRVVFHESNACPDFWEQTRVVGGVNIAESLLLCAQSLINI